MPRLPILARDRRRLQIAGWLLGAGLTVPLLLWWTFPATSLAPIPPTATPQIVRVGATLDEPIPADWQAPVLNPELEAQALAIPETLPLTSSLLAAPISADTVFTTTIAGLVASDELNLRDGPSVDYLPMAILPNTTPLTVVGRFEGWLQVVTPQRALGWVDTNYVALASSAQALPQIAEHADPNPALLAELNVERANVRVAPQTGSDIITTLGSEQGQVNLLQQRAGWFNVRTNDGTEGWVSAELLQADDYILRRVPTLSASPNALEAVRLASKYVGYPYVWGGETPRGGFDCSGLVLYVYGKLGIDMPHSAAEQWTGGYGQKITSQRDLVPGDIVFFKNTYKKGVSHVGIYAGNGNVIQALSENLGIRVSDLSNSYWNSRFVGAIRPFP